MTPCLFVFLFVTQVFLPSPISPSFFILFFEAEDKNYVLSIDSREKQKKTTKATFKYVYKK